ncbi:MAG: hypothetical protein JWP75_462 [Frondihabitans sp.]|nr:hypothetical protein [Frondihabitans sp.]
MVLKLSIAAAVVTALLVAFLVVRTSDEVAPEGTNMVVTVWQARENLTRPEAREVVEETARQHDLTLYKSVNTVTGDKTVRTLYVINQGRDRGLAPPTEDYRDFGQFLHTRYLPGHDLIDAELGGMYVTSASEADADEFARALNARGMTVTTQYFGPVGMVLWTSSLVPLVPLTAAALLALILGCAQSTISSRRRDALLLVNGSQRWRTILTYLGSGVLLTLVLGAAGVVLSLPVLALYNGLAQFSRFALAACVGLGVVAAVVTTVILLVSLGESRVRAVAALGGKRPLRQQAAAGVAIHMCSLTLVLVVVSSVVASGVDAASNRDDASSWKSADNFVSMNFHTSMAEFDSLQERFAEVAFEADRRGEVLIASHPIVTLEPGNGPDDGNSLIVNDRFLIEQRVADNRGRRVIPEVLNPNALSLLIPQDLIAHKATLLGEYREWAHFLAADRSHESNKLRAPPVDVIVTKSGQRVFNYSTGDSTSSQLDPVIAVLPSATPLVSSDWIASSMTGGEVLFDDAGTLRTEIRAAGLEPYIGSIDHVSDLAAVRLSDQERVLRASTFAGILAALITVLSSVVLAVAIAERNRRIDFARFVNGATPRTATLFRTAALALSSALALAFASLIEPFTSPIGLGAACIVVLVDLAVVGLLLAVQIRRIRADTVTRS